MFTLQVDMLTGVGVTDTQWSQDHSLFTLEVDWSWCSRHTMVTGPFLVFSTGWLEFVLQVDWNWCYRDMMVRGPFLVFSTGWLELVLQRPDGHRTIPCFLHRLTGIHSIGVTLTDMHWSQDRSFSPLVHWNWCTLQTRDDHRTIPCFLSRLTGIGVTDTQWSQDHSLFTLEVDWSWCSRHTMVTGPFLVFSTGWLEFVLQVDWNWCYRDMMVRGPFLVFSTGWLELVLLRPDGHRTIPCFLHRLTGIHSIGVTLKTCVGHRTDHFLHRFTGLGVTDTWWSQEYSLFSTQVDWNWCYRHTMVTGPFLVFSAGCLELVLQTHNGHRTIPCFLHRLPGIGVTDTQWSQEYSLFLHRLTGIGVTDTQWSQDHSLFTLEVDWSWCSRHTMVTGPFLVFSTGWLEFALQVDWNWCYRDMMVRGPFLVFSTGWLELVLQRPDGHRTIPCFLHRLTGVCVTGWLELVLQRHDGQRTIPCFLHRLTGIGVTETRWSQDHSLFSPQADWNSLNWCYTYRHALVTGPIVFSTGSLELVYLTDTWWSQDHSLFSPQVHWNWVLHTHTVVTGPFLVYPAGWLELVLQIHVGHKTIPFFLHRLTGIHSIGVTLTDMHWSQDRSFSPLVHWNWCTLQTHDDHRTIPCFLHRFTGIGCYTHTQWSQDHSLFTLQADWSWCYRYTLVTRPFLFFCTGWLEFTQLVLHLQTCIGHRMDRFLNRFTGIGVPYRHMMITGPFLVFSTGWLELVLQIHIGHRTIPCFLHRLTVYTSVCVCVLKPSGQEILFAPLVGFWPM